MKWTKSPYDYYRDNKRYISDKINNQYYAEIFGSEKDKEYTITLIATCWSTRKAIILDHWHTEVGLAATKKQAVKLINEYFSELAKEFK